MPYRLSVRVKIGAKQERLLTGLPPLKGLGSFAAVAVTGVRTGDSSLPEGARGTADNSSGAPYFAARPDLYFFRAMAALALAAMFSAVRPK